MNHLYTTSDIICPTINAYDLNSSTMVIICKSVSYWFSPVPPEVRVVPLVPGVPLMLRSLWKLWIVTIASEKIMMLYKYLFNSFTSYSHSSFCIMLVRGTRMSCNIFLGSRIIKRNGLKYYEYHTSK